MTWVERLQEVNRTTSGLVIAHLHGGDVSTTFQQSLMNTMTVDAQMFGRLRQGDRLGFISTQAGAGQIDKARNDAVAAFLSGHPEADLLLFADSDMGWEPDAPEILARTMEAGNLDVLGGLCFGQKIVGQRKYQAPDAEVFPTLYRENTLGTAAFDTAYDYPPDSVVKVAATGGAFLMISRRCLEAIGADWFTPVRRDGHPRPFGEDFSFCLRARQAGFPVHVHTGVKTSHKKEQWLTEADYKDLRRPASSAVTVVIPVKDQFEMTRNLVGDIVAQGGYSDLLLFDNGTTDPEMREWLEAQTVADVYDASDAPGISHMWNAGINEALSRHLGIADVVFLNNDLRLGPRFLRRLVGGLRSQNGVMAASGNYDGRQGSGIVPVSGICANRYDGTGGLAGFAFALRAEWIASGFRFDESMAWWYSDNDLCLELEKAGAWYGIAVDALVEHLDGGSQTATPDGWADIIAADRAAFEAKWPHVKLTAA